MSRDGLRVKHVDGDFGGGVDGAQVSEQGVAVEDVGAVGPRRLDQDLVRGSGPLPQRPPHVRQLFLQTSSFCCVKQTTTTTTTLISSINISSTKH